ncbi:MAG: hypothetical protein S4CHLAM37_13350 [Chlamydiia bacterium]|nr:hypothetical protein [Chlamydiia bacterium]
MREIKTIQALLTKVQNLLEKVLFKSLYLKNTEFHMFKKLLLSLALFFTSIHSLSYTTDFNPKPYLQERHPTTSKRYGTFYRALELLNQRKAKIIVETGTSRFGDRGYVGDGGSTIIFGHWALNNDATLYTVDISRENIIQAKNATELFKENTHYCVSDSIKFLKEFKSKIDFLYLDSFDYSFKNPYPSQAHHLKEIQVAYDKLHENSVIMIDDCNIRFGGKGKLAIEFLLKRGWKIDTNDYQVILTR